jgi:hypothetical protein
MNLPAPGVRKAEVSVVKETTKEIRFGGRSSLDLYLNEIAAYPLLARR